MVFATFENKMMVMVWGIAPTFCFFAFANILVCPQLCLGVMHIRLIDSKLKARRFVVDPK